MTIWRCFIDNNTGKLECDDDEDGQKAIIMYWTNDETLGYWLKFARQNTKAYTAIAYDDETGKVMFLEDFEEHVS